MDIFYRNVETKNITFTVLSSTVVIFVSGYVALRIYRYISNAGLITKKRNELELKKQKLLTKLESLKTPFQNIDKITNLKLMELINGLKSGLFTHEDLIQAYQAKALMMDKEYNFITDLNTCIEDDLIKVKTFKNELLNGIPVSIKECYSVKGCCSTYGMLDQAFNNCETDDTAVVMLRLMGMIPYISTNMCQSGLSMESSNPIYGETLNPHNKIRTCGGSSGGEATALCSKSSILGLGSDIGGSIRIPAAYCGIYGLKPTNQRFCSKHMKTHYSSQNIIAVTIGPMARHIDDLIIFYKAMASIDLQYLDPYCPPLAFNDLAFEDKKPLRIGYYFHLGGNQVTPVPAVVRGVEIAKEALEAAGHTLVEFSIPDIDYAIFDLYLRCLFTDGGTGMIDHFFKDNPIDQSLLFTTFLLKIPNCFKRILSILLKPFSKVYSNTLRVLTCVPSIYKLWEIKDKVTQYKAKVACKWHNEKLDGLICPVLPICAPPLQTSSFIQDIVGYTSIYNLLEYPAGSVPVSNVMQEDIDQLLNTYPRDTITHRRIIEYQKDSVGMPIGVQCVSMMWKEETCLRIMKQISDFIKKT